jgi:hypothetical protein
MSDIPNFEDLKLNVPETVKSYSAEKQREIYDYLSELDDHSKKAYEIAANHLGSSFHITRSNGFKEWKTYKNSK